VRSYVPAWLEFAGLHVDASTLRALEAITDELTQQAAQAAIRRTHRRHRIRLPRACARRDDVAAEAACAAACEAMHATDCAAIRDDVLGEIKRRDDGLSIDATAIGLEMAWEAGMGALIHAVQLTSGLTAYEIARKAARAHSGAEAASRLAQFSAGKEAVQRALEHHTARARRVVVRPLGRSLNDIWPTSPLCA
jgi:hypothetical protein